MPQGAGAGTYYFDLGASGRLGLAQSPFHEGVALAIFLLRFITWVSVLQGACVAKYFSWCLRALELVVFVSRFFRALAPSPIILSQGRRSREFCVDVSFHGSRCFRAPTLTNICLGASGRWNQIFLILVLQGA